VGRNLLPLLPLRNAKLYVLIVDMKSSVRTASLFLSLSLALSTAAMAEDASQKPSPFDSPKAKNSYAIGMNVGQTLKSMGIEVDSASLVHGIDDVLKGNPTLLNEGEVRQLLSSLQQEARAKRDAELKVQGENNKKDGEAFLAENKTKEGVVTLPSGLQYKILRQGHGPKPVATDTVVCDYRGTFINGKEFDSSYRRGQSASFPVGGVIKGWTEILQLMPVGSNYQVFVPAELAYGEHPPSADIGPNAVLIFNIELLDIKGLNAGSAPAAPAGK
jgi:FKBP-type peptidyl-prolyl cis-trans isomerase FklB